METITIPRSEYEALLASNIELLAKNKALEEKVKVLEEKILDLHQRLFGKKKISLTKIITRQVKNRTVIHKKANVVASQ